MNLSRRGFLGAGLVGMAGMSRGGRGEESDGALISITLDLEMSRNFPGRDDMHWDYEKGNLNDPTKAYAEEACRRVKADGGVIHCFAVGQVFEQEDVSWLKRIASSGHPVGNHTYDHVNVLAERLEDVQFRFKRAPWLAEGRTASTLIRDNVRLAEAAMKERLGIAPDGFRTPGGFAEGLRSRPDVRAMLLKQGYTWVSSLYPAHLAPTPREEPTEAMFESILRAQPASQPFFYPDGLIEIPMSPISDIGAFRTGQWQLEGFLKAVRLGVEWAIENRAVYDFLSHPSCLYVTDPEFRAIELICSLVKKAGKRASIVGLGALASRASAK